MYGIPLIGPASTPYGVREWAAEGSTAPDMRRGTSLRGIPAWVVHPSTWGVS